MSIIRNIKAEINVDKKSNFILPLNIFYNQISIGKFNYIIIMLGATGFEPVTPAFSRQ